jgi:hypothetical protein
VHHLVLGTEIDNVHGVALVVDELGIWIGSIVRHVFLGSSLERRWRRTRQGMAFVLSDPQEMEHELVVGRYTEEQRSPEVEQFHPVGDLFLDQHQSAIHEGLTEK